MDGAPTPLLHQRIRNVNIVRVLINRERWQHVLGIGSHCGIDHYRSRPRVAVVVGTHEENIRIRSTAKRQTGGIAAYETKYGSSFSRYYKTFSCSDATPDEMTDVMDWELLIEEKALRMKTPRREKVY